MEVLAATQAEMNAIIAGTNIMISLTRDLPSVVDGVYKLGEELSVYSEKHKKWIGSLNFIHVRRAIVPIQSQNGSK